MLSERSDGSLGQLIEPQDDPSEEEEEVELKEDRKAEDELVVSVNLDAGSDISEGGPAVELLFEGETKTTERVQIEIGGEVRKGKERDSHEAKSRRCSST